LTTASKDRPYAGVRIGQTIYDEAGEPFGSVRDIDGAGVCLLAPEDAPEPPIAEARELTGRDYGMWRCWECGTMGQIEDSLPAECPGCAAPPEALYRGNKTSASGLDPEGEADT
jgi:hypothetical protein